MFLISILCYILLSIGVILFSIILIPYDYYVFGKKLDEIYIKGTVSWLFGGLKISFYKYTDESLESSITFLGMKKKINTGKRVPEPKEKHEKKPEKEGKKSNLNANKYFKKDIIKKAINAFIRILNHCTPRKFFVRARIGFEDPSNTGFMCAVLGSVYTSKKKYDIRIQPVFDEEIFEGRFLIGGRIWLAYPILVAVGFLFTKPFRNILMSDLKLKFKGGTQYAK